MAKEIFTKITILKGWFDFFQFQYDLEWNNHPVTGEIERLDKDTIKLVLDDELSVTVDGDFNKKLTDGTIEKFNFFLEGEPLYKATDLDFDLSDWRQYVDASVADAVFIPLLNQNYLYGTKNDDVLFSRGPSRMFGGAGDDVLVDRSPVAHKYDGETGNDTVDYGREDSIIGVTANLADSSKNLGWAKSDTFQSIENLIGTALDDTLVGNDRTNILMGGGGADVIDGGGGIDLASYANSTASIVFDLSDPTRNEGDVLADTLISIEGVFGTDFGDELSGDAGNNIIYGAFGDDIIDGGGGTDTLWGDSKAVGVVGDDTFVFHGPGHGLKKIMDFDPFDHIQISRAGFNLHPMYQIAEGTTLIVVDKNPTALTNSPTFLFEKSTGNLLFDADGNGTAAAELIAKVKFHSQEYIETNDFVIV